MKLKAEQIVPNLENPRYIKDENFRKLVQSLKDFPEMAEVRPIVVNKDYVILGGNMRFKAMQQAGWTEIPVTVVDWPEDKQKEFIIKDNVSGGDWDWDVLANEWDATELEAWGLDLPAKFGDEEVEEDEAPEVSKDPPQSVLGAVYQLGRHRVMCGDSTDKASVELLMDGQKADLILTDPPYNIASDSTNFASDVSKAMKDLSESEWDKGFDTMTVVPILQDIANDNSTTYIFTSHFLFGELFEQYKNWADFTSYNVWSKPNPMPSLAKRHWTWSSELCLYATKGKQVFNFINGEHNLSVWSITKKSDGSHPTQKPIELLANIVQHSSNKGQLVADLFLGSGSTLIACEQTDRTCYGMELDPKYTDVIRRRYWKFVNNGDETGWQENTSAIDVK